MQLSHEAGVREAPFYTRIHYNMGSQVVTDQGVTRFYLRSKRVDYGSITSFHLKPVTYNSAFPLSHKSDSILRIYEVLRTPADS
jgi:hypothetical protein